MGSAPAAASLLADAAERAKPTTSWPRSRSVRTTGAPIEPVPPRMKTRIRLLAIAALPDLAASGEYMRAR